MFTQDVSILIAFGAGVFSFFSPCVLPMIPAYIMYLTGSRVEDDLKDMRRLAVIRTLGFILGFTIVFLIMGASASIIGRVFARNRIVFSRISGLIIMFFGLNMLGLFSLEKLRIRRRVRKQKPVKSWFQGVLMGLAFAGGWTPCFGPILASILVYAGGMDMAKGIFLLLVYSLGMGIPFLLTAGFIEVFLRWLDKNQRILNYLPKIGGLVVFIFGLLIFTNKIVEITRLLI